MSHTLKLCISFLLAVCMVMLLASVALAEPTDTETEPGTETSETPPAESSEGGDDSSETPPADTRPISVIGDVANVQVFFGDATEPAVSHSAAVGSTVSFRVLPLDGYQVDSVKAAGNLLTPDENGVYAFTVDEDVNSYVIRIAASSIGDTSSGDPNPSDDPSSDDPTSDPSDTSGSESSESPYDPEKYSELQVTVTGAGTVSANGQSTSNTGDVAKTEILYLEKNVATQVAITPAYGYTLQALRLDGVARAPQEQMTLTINETTTLELVFAPDVAQPTQYQIVISCETAGGYVSAGGYSVTNGNNKTISINAGGSLTISVYPSEGYEVDAFKVGGAVQNLSGGTYIMENIAANTNVTVSFKPTTSTVTVLEASDFNWTPAADGLIVLDLGSNTYIGKSVFDKINTLSATDGEFVMIKTQYVRWYIPCGGKIGGISDAYVHLSVGLNANGSYYSTIEASIRAQDPDTVFNYYELSFVPEFPEGTQASFYLADLAIAYNGNGVDLMVKSGSTLTVIGQGNANSDGWTSRMTYRGSKYNVVRIEIADQYTIEASAGEGGRIDPSGSNSVALQGSCSFRVTSNSGYIISAVYVDNIPVAGAAGTETYAYAFTGVTGNHTIRATFIPSGSDYSIVNNVAVVQGDTSGTTGGRSHTGLIVALVIVFVAIAGAATLFIVKWRQEKF